MSKEGSKRQDRIERVITKAQQ